MVSLLHGISWGACKCVSLWRELWARAGIWRLVSWFGEVSWGSRANEFYCWTARTGSCDLWLYRSLFGVSLLDGWNEPTACQKMSEVRKSLITGFYSNYRDGASWALIHQTMLEMPSRVWGSSHWEAISKLCNRATQLIECIVIVLCWFRIYRIRTYLVINSSKLALWKTSTERSGRSKASQSLTRQLQEIGSWYATVWYISASPWSLSTWGKLRRKDNLKQ